MRTAVKVALLVAILAITGCRTCHHHGRGVPYAAEHQRCQVPYCIGMDHDLAETTVMNAHLVPKSSAPSGTCTAQRPNAGTWLTCGDVVELTYGTNYDLKQAPAPAPAVR